MKRSIKSLLATLVVPLSLAAPVLAGPSSDGWAAYNRKDYVTALRLWRPLAEQGEAGAQFNIAGMYGRGEGVPQDYVKALMWFRKAAEQKHADAQFNLGIMYDQGQGVPQDYSEAHKWYNLAAAQGDKDAANSRDLIAKEMTPSQIAEAQRLAREWKPKK